MPANGTKKQNYLQKEDTAIPNVPTERSHHPWKLLVLGSWILRIAIPAARGTGVECADGRWDQWRGIPCQAEGWDDPALGVSMCMRLF